MSTLAFCPTPLFTSEMADVNKIVKMQFKKNVLNENWQVTNIMCKVSKCGQVSQFFIQNLTEFVW